MELAMGAMGPLFPKLLQLLKDEYIRQRGLKGEVESLSREMKMVHATLVDVSRVPPEWLKEQDKLWARQIRELSYDMEDAIDAFMVRVARREATPADTSIFKKVAHKFTRPIKKMKERHHISEKIQDIKNLSKELSELRARYAFNGEVPPVNTGIDPRVINLYKNEGELVGIEEARDQLIRMLTQPEDDKSLKIMSIVGCGGLGKTTLAKILHDKLNAQSFQCCAVVSVGRNPNITNTFRELYEKLAGNNCSSMVNWTAERFREELHELLKDKRYNIVVDDVWDKKTWNSIRCALPDSKCGSKVIVTTRNSEVDTKASDVYKLKPLPLEKSKELFYKRTTGSNNGDDQLMEKIVEKCDGVPLAIIAIASLLANRPLEDWQMVYSSLIFGREDDSTREILLYSYYDLPSYLRPCLLYMSMYPEDSFITKSSLIWRWIAEGFVQSKKEGGSLSEIGERYFNELVNRSMIEPANDEDYMLEGCRVHDIVLDLVCDLSTEENFVTVLSEKKSASSEKDTSRNEDLKVRRLSIQWSNGVKLDTFKDTIGMPEVVRSINTTRGCPVDGIMLSGFQSCRVLAVERITDYYDDIRNLEHLGKLLNLRYLEIHTFQELPSEIGDLKCLQTLITPAKVLPSTVCELTQLMCLLAVNAVNIPADRIGNLVSLEELHIRVTTKDAADIFVVKLGKLIRLRVLSISFDLDDSSMNETFYMALIQSLNNLQECGSVHLRKLGIVPYETRTAVVSAWKSWKPPRQLWHLNANMGHMSLQLMDLSRCQRLRHLDLAQMNVVDIGILALLPELVSVRLHDPYSYLHTDECITVGAEGFKNLRVFEVPRKFKFLPGAMPRLESLSFMVSPAEGDLDFGLGNLVSLKELEIDIVCYNFEIEEKRAVLKRAVEDHPNRPTFRYTTIHELKPNKALKFRIRVRDGIDMLEAFLSRYPCLEEIDFKIDCEGSRLSEVEQLEEGLREVAARHPSRPKLVMTRINQDRQ